MRFKQIDEGDEMQESVLKLANIGKTFQGVNVLRNINLEIYKGEVLALLGENGAGKSTLIKILSGYHQPDKGGIIEMDGKVHNFRRPKDAKDASIHTIYQELTLCPLMSVEENIVIDKQEYFKGILQSRKGYREIAVSALEILGQSHINPSMIVKDLSIAQQQVVEIAKAISANAKIILMDEPTSSISQEDARKLMSIIRSLRDKGVTIVYISHRLHEIGEIADRVTVLRDGNLVDTIEKSKVSDQDLINMMVGRELTNVFPKRQIKLGESVLRIEGLTSERTFSNISFEVHKGEIFGIGGLIGSKRTEVLEALFGLRKITSGNIYLHGKPFVPHNPINAIKHKIAFVTEDRKKSGLVLCLPVFENLNMINAQKKSPLGYLNWKALMDLAQRQQKHLDIKITKLKQRVSTLSGGNQQKVVLGKWMDFEPDIILFDEPTRGIDIGAKTEIYNFMGDLAEKGAAIIMVSSELPELISIADNIMVMSEGVVKGTVSQSDASQQVIMTLAAIKN